MSKIELVEVLGPGCPRCQQAHRVVQHVVEESGLDVEVRKVEGIDRMIELGILATPAIAIDGQVKIAGQVPETAMVRRLLGLEA